MYNSTKPQNKCKSNSTSNCKSNSNCLRDNCLRDNCLRDNCLRDNCPVLTIIYGRDEKIRSKFANALSVAISEARKSPMATQYGAVICNENTGEIYTKGHNHWKSVQTNKAMQCLLCP